MTFYSAFTDNRLILDRIFEKGESDVFQFRSDPHKPVRQFDSVEAIEHHYQIESWENPHSTTLFFNIYHRDAGGELKTRKIETTSGEVFDSVEGWGLIQLYFMPWDHDIDLRSGTLQCNSEERARNWSDTGSDRLGDYRLWDWEVVRRYKGRLESFIRRQKVDTLHGQPILSAASHVMSRSKSEQDAAPNP